MKAVAFSPAAEADIGDIWDYSADRWGPDQADNYIDAIRDACYALAQGTKHGRPVDVLPEFMKYLCGSHVVYFLDYSDHLDVIRCWVSVSKDGGYFGQRGQQITEFLIVNFGIKSADS